MKITVEFKAYFAKFTGDNKVDLEITSPARIIDLIQLLNGKFPNLFTLKKDMCEEELRSQALVVVGNKVVFKDYPLSDKEIISIYPPICGGGYFSRYI